MNCGAAGRHLRRHFVALACLLAAGAIGVAAIADHRDKQRRIDRAEVAEWYCTYYGIKCGGASSARIEAHWQWRQRGYEALVITLSAFALVRFGYELGQS